VSIEKLDKSVIFISLDEETVFFHGHSDAQTLERPLRAILFTFLLARQQEQ